MALTGEQRWTLVGCGLIAHADERLEVGEWDRAVALLEGEVDVDEVGSWLDKLTDPSELEVAFAALPEVPEASRRGILEGCWRMALADGEGSDVEEAVHDRIAHQLGVSAQDSMAWRAEWNKNAATRGELALGLAAVLANLDGRLDPAEAAKFAELLERTPVPVNRRLQLGEQLLAPPELEAVVRAMSELPLAERMAALRDLAPMVHASARGDDERAAFLDIASRLGVNAGDAERLLF